MSVLDKSSNESVGAAVITMVTTYVQYSTIILNIILLIILLLCSETSCTDIIPSSKNENNVQDIRQTAIINSKNVLHNISSENNVTLYKEQPLFNQVNATEVTSFTVDLYIMSVGSIMSASIFLIIVSTYIAFVHWKIYKKQRRNISHCCESGCHQSTVNSLGPIQLSKVHTTYDDAGPLFRRCSLDQLPPVLPVFPEELHNKHTYITMLPDAIPLPSSETMQRSLVMNDLEESDTGYLSPKIRSTSVCVDNLPVVFEGAAKEPTKIIKSLSSETMQRSLVMNDLEESDTAYLSPKIHSTSSCVDNLPVVFEGAAKESIKTIKSLSS